LLPRRLLMPLACRCLLLVLLPLAGLSQGQGPSGGENPAAVAGVAVDGSSGEPLSKVRLLLRRDPGRAAPRTTSTDREGRFALTGIPPGRYRLSAERNGFAPQEWGQRSPSGFGSAFELHAGEALDDLVFRLMPGAVITGQIADQDGEPNAEVEVTAYRLAYQRGRPRLMPVRSDRTDDRGEYRLYGLPAGRYYVVASFSRFPGMPGPFGGGGRSAGVEAEEDYLPTFYPGVHEARQATPVEAAPGSELNSVNFKLRSESTVKLTGRIETEEGQRGRASLLVTPRDPLQLGRHRGGVRENGEFEIRGLAPGSYSLIAQMRGRGDRQSARLGLEVGNQDIRDLVIPLIRDLTLEGRLEWDAEAETDASGLRLVLEPQEPGAGGAAATPAADASLRFENVPTNLYRLGLRNAPGDVYIKAATLGGVDVLEQGLDINPQSASGGLMVLLSPKGAQASGVVADNDGRPVEGAQVLLAPEQRQMHRPDLFQQLDTDADGIFLLRGVPPGRYRLFAWDNLEEVPWRDAAYLKQFESQSVPCDLSEGDTRSFDLRLITAR
jgi:protocatechuate 3,4-dioxygenase beta subunit